MRKEMVELFEIDSNATNGYQTELRIRVPPGYSSPFFDLIMKLRTQYIEEAEQEWQQLMELKEEWGMSDDEFDDWISRIQNEVEWE